MTHNNPKTAPPVALQQFRGFRLLWTGETISLLGNSTSALLLPLVAVTQFGAGPGWMGILTAAAWLPWLVIGLPAGAWVDVWNPRRVMLWANLIAGLTTLGVPVAWFAGWLSLPQLLVVAAINGTCTVFFRAAYQRLLPRLVPTEKLVAANSALQGTESATQLAGRALPVCSRSRSVPPLACCWTLSASSPLPCSCGPSGCRTSAPIRIPDRRPSRCALGWAPACASSPATGSCATSP